MIVIGAYIFRLEIMAKVVPHECIYVSSRSVKNPVQGICFILLLFY